ncbi:MAG: DNA topoisomerase (ATP-hydrolyzing) [Candidatus Binatia bacterium]|nr:MAG: DNA topoisomerase (ATP-hydrolyzing) [Candidatus Binatia bacterium]
MKEAAEIELRKAAEERYLSYALSVITARALPDVRDGLKPVQRRILYAMYQNLRLGPDAKPRKSAAVVGEVLGKYHPHGDVAAYEAMVRMAQPFSLRYPLVHGEGNFGSLDGDSPAAMRYTEVRLAPIAEELLRDLRADTVEFRDNYDATLREPVVLPARFPQLLANGSSGIAVGMATNIPPHNLRELCQALVALVRDPRLETKDLCRWIQGPDFPTGGEILNSRKELRKIYETGQGAIRLRGEYTVETSRRKKIVVVTSVPYQVNKARVVEQIAEHIASRRLPQATDVRDESTDRVRIVVEIKPDASPEAVMAYLFRHTDLQVNFHVNLTALVPTAVPGVGQPARLDLAALCRHFLDFRFTVVTRRLEHELAEVERRLHLLEGFARIFGDLDKALRIVRRSRSRSEAAEKLERAFGLDREQADAILETRLYQLARLEIERIEEERREKRERARELRKQLGSEKERWRIVERELEEIAEKYGDARRTRIGRTAELVYDAEAYVVHEPTTIVLTRDGWVKRLGEVKDPRSTRVREGDAVRWVLRGDTKQRLVVFTNFGVLYSMKAVQVPATTGYGEPLQKLLRFQDRERVVHAMLAGEEEDGRGRLLVASLRGTGFFTSPDLSETTRSGRRFARLKEGDEVVAVVPARGEVVTVCTRGGKVLSFRASEVPELSGPGRGVILARLDPEDGLAGAVCHPEGKKLVAVGTDGSERRFAPPELGKRGQKGRKVLGRFEPLELRAEEAAGTLF